MNEELKTYFGQPESSTIEILPGLTSEEMRAVYFNADALREPGFKLYQLNGQGHRYYYRYDEQGEPQFYPSVTTLLHQTMPTSPFLIKWIVENGEEQATEKRDLAALYGTFMHIQFEHLLINRRIDFDGILPAELLEYIKQNNLPDRFFEENIGKIRKDICAFAQWVVDWNVRPLAVEISLYHPEYHYAGCLDLPCIMTDPKSKKDFAGLVDFKSGRKGFWEEHEIQLHLYKDMWNIHFPDKPIERVFNFSPKDWRKSPTYNFKEQTDSPNARKVPYLLALAAIEDEKRTNEFTMVHGVLELDKWDASTNIIALTLSDLIKTRAKSAEETPNPDKGPKEAI